MVQVRLMGDDPERVGQVAAILRDAIERDRRLRVGDATTLANRRGPGIRIVFDLTPEESRAEPDVEFVVERVPPRPARRARELPPGRGREIGEAH